MYPHQLVSYEFRFAFIYKFKANIFRFEGDRPKNKIKLPPVDPANESFIPSEANALPPIYTATRTNFQFIDATNDGQLMATLHNETVTFAVQRNFYVMVRIVKCKSYNFLFYSKRQRVWLANRCC